MEIINAELILADIESLQRKMGDNEKKVRAHEKEALARQSIYERLMTHLNA
jgi:ribosome-binding ATPase YchF (GTP1/OBG family)